MLKKLDQTQPDPNRPTVLVVDDTAVIRRVLTKILEGLGYTTIVADDGQTAWRAIVDFHPTAVVTDLEMPNMKGDTLVAEIRGSSDARIADMPIIVCSSKSDDFTVAQLKSLGADAFLSKPVSSQILTQAANRLF
ncbi:Chemotaxis protein CheY [Rubripirellula lacrimiformis]|uniref:Chemotaxis protein CheY n=1 Tax=Rubripirellula lacrimiformis TaxID=1930273 RepID=A0A517NDR3_9BACT|nr:response regulator [Rubripirellula lacrimiformis]QDT05269.1 Chemotaxis protein CheY [Rubripirellula lacrimiformis]